MSPPVSTVETARTVVPVAASSRIATLDVLRGFALLGMILVHFHKTMGVPAAEGSAQGIIDWFITVCVSEKDRAVFAFLFGVGFALMLRQWEARGTPIVAIYVRRLLVLYVIGFAVDTLTRFTILRDYAWWGIPLFFLRGLTTRSLLALVVICASAHSIRDLADSGYNLATRDRERVVAVERLQLDQANAALQAQAEAMNQASYGAAVAARFRHIVFETGFYERITPNEYLALFILGLLAVRYRVFEDPARHRRILMAAVMAGLVIWASYWWLLSHVPQDFISPRVAMRARTGFGLFDEQYLAFTCIGAITLAMTLWPRVRPSLLTFAWAGRMALTNYVLHAALLEYAAGSYGLGLRLAPAQQLLGGATLFVAIAAFSRWWLSRYRFGPLEWGWRSLTYWRLQPMRLSRKEPAIAGTA